MSNFYTDVRNLNTLIEAEKTLKNFLSDTGGTIYISNPDGTCLKLDKDSKFVAITALAT